jgi:(1->4)-alpha-D-glucan 1-alpha-D-glucosylmutase
MLRRSESHDAAPAAAPDANDEYYFYQSLLGAWPPELCDSAEIGAATLAEFAERMQGAMTKAAREAKRHTNWAVPDERYESALRALVEAALTPGNEFLARFAPFASRVARLGVHVSLVQLALKMTAPGVPDIYQGGELWDFSLVDPDNRRPVDFARRAALLEAVDEQLAGDAVRALTEWRRQWQDGRIKLATTRTLLALRAREAVLFAAGDYVPCEVTGPRAGEIVAYARRYGPRAVVTLAHRFPVRAAASSDWSGTRILLQGAAGRVVDVFTRRGVELSALDPAQLFSTLPIAVLAPRDADAAARA